MDFTFKLCLHVLTAPYRILVSLPHDHCNKKIGTSAMDGIFSDILFGWPVLAQLTVRTRLHIDGLSNPVFLHLCTKT